MRYVIVTPAQNEAEHIERTLESVISQTILPMEWVIVNDGSSDRTGDIAESYALRHPWIRVIHRENAGPRKAGAAVVEAFYTGYNTLETMDWDFVVKLDGDVSFDADYFERCFEQFTLKPKLGIGGGVICYAEDGSVRIEENPLFHVRGATKIYRRECWSAIGGLFRVSGWDTVDELKANMLGWETRSFPRLKLVHFRHTGQAYGPWGNWAKNGVGAYVCGYHPLFMFVKCLKLLFHKPYVIASLGLSYGFVMCYVKRTPRTDDKDLIRYVRGQQLRRLVGRDSLWG